MNIKLLKDSDLFATRLKIIYFGLDLQNRPAGDNEIVEIENELRSRNLKTTKAGELVDTGIDWANAGNFQQASLAFKEATKLCPRYLDAWANLAASYVDQFLFDEAFQILKTTEIQIGTTFDMSITYGRCLVQMGRPKEALEKFAIAERLGRMTDYLQEDIDAAKWHLNNTSNR